MRKSSFFVIMIMLTLTLLPYFILAFFTVPAADDFCQANSSLYNGLLGHVKSRYLNWNGRYFADFLVASYNIIGHSLANNFLINFYYISSYFFMVLYGFSNLLFILILFQRRNLITGCIFSLIALISCLTYTEVRSTFFWFSGGIAYTLSNSLFILLVAMLIRFYYIKSEKYLFWTSLIFIPIINGLSETIMVSCTTFILALSFLNTLLPSFRDRFTVEKIVLSTAAISSALIVYMAPGNAVRFLSDGQSEINYIHIIISTLKFGFLKMFNWINPFWIALFIIILFLSHYIFDDKDVKKVLKNKKVFFSIIISLLMSFFASYFACFYSLGNAGPARAESISYTMFFLMTVFFGFFIGLNFNLSEIATAQINDKLLILFVALFCCFSFVSNYSYYPLKNDFEQLKSHYSYYQKTYQTLIKADSNSEIELPPEPRVKILRWKCYLTHDKNYYVNQAVATYFGIKSVIVKGSDGPDPDSPGNTGACGGTLSWDN